MHDPALNTVEPADLCLSSSQSTIPSHFRFHYIASHNTEKMFDATSQSIPVVDLSSPTAAQGLLDAAVTFGFIFVKHTDDLPLKPRDVDDMFSLVREIPKTSVLYLITQKACGGCRGNLC
jgi:hypothetical protein